MPNRTRDWLEQAGRDSERATCVTFLDAATTVARLPWTAAERHQRLAEDDPFAREIVARGIVLAGALDAEQQRE